MDYSEIENIIEDWFGPGELLLTWKDEKGNQCNLWLELFEGEFTIESQRYNAGETSETDFDGHYKTFPDLRSAKDAMLSFALIASDYYELKAETTE